MKTVIQLNSVRKLTVPRRDRQQLLWQFLPMKWIKDSIKNIRVVQRKEYYSGTGTAFGVRGFTEYYVIDISFEFRKSAKHEMDINEVLWNAPFVQYYKITLQA